MSAMLYARAQIAFAQLKGAVCELLQENPSGLKNAQIGRVLGIYGGHSGQAGHISRTLLEALQHEGVVSQDPKTKLWRLRGHSEQSDT